MNTYENCVKLFKSKFSIPQESIVLFVTGSATTALESVLFSINKDVEVVTTGGFSSRLLKSAIVYGKYSLQDQDSATMSVNYETGKSEVYVGDLATLADCTSSFPYYTPQEDVWVTTTSKQLGSVTGLSVIVIRNQEVMDQLFYGECQSYLSVARYYEFSKKNQTPNTPNIDAFVDLEQRLRQFDLDAFRAKVDSRRTMVVDMLNSKGVAVIGEGPVVTVAQRLGVLEDEFGMYKNTLGQPQLFLWSGTDAQYEQFIKRGSELL
jgi:aspartate aminotransferase-like enzyme